MLTVKIRYAFDDPLEFSEDDEREKQQLLARTKRQHTTHLLESNDLLGFSRVVKRLTRDLRLTHNLLLDWQHLDSTKQQKIIEKLQLQNAINELPIIMQTMPFTRESLNRIDPYSDREVPLGTTYYDCACLAVFFDQGVGKRATRLIVEAANSYRLSCRS
jgi:hypothetical protein